MKQHCEMIAKIVKPREIPTQKGFIYAFSVPIFETTNTGDQLTEWLQCSIFMKDRDPRILKHKGEFHFSGQLKVKKAYKNYPQGLNLFGFQLDPVLGNIYRQSKPKTYSQDAPQAPEAVPEVSRQASNDYRTPDFPDNPAGDRIPM